MVRFLQQGGRDISKHLWNRNFILIILANCCIFVSFQMLMPTIPMFAQRLGAAVDLVGILTGAFVVTAFAVRPFAGRALGVWNRRNVYITGLLVIIVSILGYSQVNTVTNLLALRLLHGIGWSITSTAASTMATDFIPGQRLGEGMGYYGLSSVLAMATAPALGLYLVKAFGFSPLFKTSVALAITGAVIGLFITYPGSGSSKPQLASERPSGFFEKKAYRPTVITFFLGLTYSAVTTFISLYAAQLRISNIGTFFTVYAMALLVARPTSGRLADKKGFSYAIAPGLICVALSMLILAFSNQMPGFLVAAVFYGIGFGSAQPSLQAMAVHEVPARRRGAANSTLLLGVDLAIGTGSMLSGVLVKLAGYSAMYLSAVVPVLIALSITLSFGGTRGNLGEIKTQTEIIDEVKRDELRQFVREKRGVVRKSPRDN